MVMMHQKMLVEKTKTIQILSAKRNEDYKYQRLANYLMIMIFLKSKDHINDQNENIDLAVSFISQNFV